MKKINLLLIIFCSLLVMASCKKDEELHPKIVTLSADPVSGSSVLLKANVLATGSLKVLDHGFVITGSFISERKISMNKAISEGVYETEVEGLSGHNNVRAYITNEKGTAYGELLNFSMPSPAVSNLSASAGKAGDHISIHGSNLPTDKSQIIVKFQETVANIVEASSNKIVVEVPEGIFSNNIYVTVHINSSYYTSFNFNILPSFTGFEPKSGTIGTTITLLGNYLTYSQYTVYLNEIPVHVNNYYNSSVQVQVPYGITSEKVKIKVIASGNVFELKDEFTIVPPTISSFSPASGIGGALVTIFGANLANFGSNTIAIGNQFASIQNAEPTYVQVLVPNGLAPGDYDISINTGVHSTVSPSKFKVVSPEISSFSPTSGIPGTTVNIYGSNLNAGDYNTSVKFGTYTANILSANENVISVSVPSGLIPGDMKISVSAGGQTVVSEGDFTLIGPSISSISPLSGVPGTKVTITGDGFSSDSYNSQVYFGNVATTVISASRNTLEVLVPSNAGTGEKTVTVSVFYRNAEAIQKFTIL